MKRFDCLFSARRIGSIGAWDSYHFTVEADTESIARLKLYDHFEHIQGRITELGADAPLQAPLLPDAGRR